MGPRRPRDLQREGGEATVRPTYCAPTRFGRGTALRRARRRGPLLAGRGPPCTAICSFFLLFLELAEMGGHISVVRLPLEAGICMLGAPSRSAGVKLFSTESNFSGHSE